MAPPSALIGITYLAVIFAQVCASPFWSQPDCPDQGQSGYWSGSDYESQGPSYQQTLQAMVEETLRCIQQVIQVTKREMVLLLRQLAQDADCNPPGNNQAESYDDGTSGQMQFPPPDSGYNYDRPQQQLYPAQYQSNEPAIQPQPQLQLQDPIHSQVQIHYQTQVQLQEIPKIQPLYRPDSESVLNTGTPVVNVNDDDVDRSKDVPPPTVENKILFSAARKIRLRKPKTNAGLVKRPNTMGNIKPSSTTLEGIQGQSKNVPTKKVSPNSNLSNMLSNIISTLSDTSAINAIGNLIHNNMDEYGVTGSRPAATSTNFTTDSEMTSADNDGIDRGNGGISSSNSSTIDLSNTPILVNGAPIYFSNVISTTARNNNTTDNNYSENTPTIPSSMDNVVDVNMENLAHKKEMHDRNILSSNNVTTSPLPVEQTRGNHYEINTVTLKYNDSVESNATIEGNASEPQQNMTESTTKALIRFSAFGNSTNETKTEIISKSGSTMTINKHVTTTNSTVTNNILTRKTKQ